MDRSRERNVVLVINIFIYTTVAVFTLLGSWAPPVVQHDLALSRLATIYSLTEYGQTLNPIVQAICAWGREHMADQIETENIS